MLPESDWNLLEAYLDDALSTSEVQRLDSRLGEEPALSAGFDALRAQRAARMAVFQSAAPTSETAEGFADRMLSSIRRRERNTWVVRNVRRAGVVAACLVVGIAVGWMGRGRGVVMPPAMVNATPVAAPHAHGDAHRVIHTPKPPEPGQYQVAVLDEAGNVIALQRFSKLEDARQFADDLGQYELRRQQVQESQAMLVSDRF